MGPGIVLISLAAPAGDLGAGPVENVEVVRLAMTYSTFKEVAELFERAMADLNHGNGAVAPHAVEPHQRFKYEARPRGASKGN
jgi:hypothetical protein